MLSRFSKTYICLKRIQFKRVLSSLNYSTCDDISVQNDKIKKYLEDLKNEFYSLRVKGNERTDHEYDRMDQISKVVDSYEKRLCVLKNLEQVGDLENEKDEDMKQLVKEESEVYSKIISDLDKTIIKELLECTGEVNCKTVIFEINAGAGGQEAMLFANELYDMYCNFISLKNWDYEVLDTNYTDIGGLRYASLLVTGKNVYSLLENEAGVHRVQRIPVTERSGRMHTSTVSVSVVPRPDDINITLEEKSLRIETKRASGAGGQHVNTTDSAVRITHLPTGISVECQTERSQLRNKETALKKLKNILIKKEYTDQETSKRTTKKQQIGSSNRNEKIRTYNFTQDRVTDHRLTSGTRHNLKEFLQGDHDLNDLICELHIHTKKQKLLSIIENYKSIS